MVSHIRVVCYRPHHLPTSPHLTSHLLSYLFSPPHLLHTTSPDLPTSTTSFFRTIKGSSKYFVVCNITKYPSHHIHTYTTTLQILREESVAKKPRGTHVSSSPSPSLLTLTPHPHFSLLTLIPYFSPHSSSHPHFLLLISPSLFISPSLLTPHFSPSLLTLLTITPPPHSSPITSHFSPSLLTLTLTPHPHSFSSRWKWTLATSSFREPVS